MSDKNECSLFINKPMGIYLKVALNAYLYTDHLIVIIDKTHETKLYLLYTH